MHAVRTRKWQLLAEIKSFTPLVAVTTIGRGPACLTILGHRDGTQLSSNWLPHTWTGDLPANVKSISNDSLYCQLKWAFLWLSTARWSRNRHGVEPCSELQPECHFVTPVIVFRSFRPDYGAPILCVCGTRGLINHPIEGAACLPIKRWPAVATRLSGLSWGYHPGVRTLLAGDHQSILHTSARWTIL